MEDKLKIITIPNKILSRRTKKVKKFDDRLKELIGKMRIAEKESKGIGLAAPQVGHSLQLAIMEYDPPQDENVENENKKVEQKIPFTVIINPRVIWHSEETAVVEEGCLSIPGVELPVERWLGIEIEARNENGETRKIDGKGLVARIIQHELDHLNGILITDKAIKNRKK